MNTLDGEMSTVKRKRTARVVSGNLELIVEEIKHANNNGKFKDSLSLDERLNIVRILTEVF